MSRPFIVPGGVVETAEVDAAGGSGSNILSNSITGVPRQRSGGSQSSQSTGADDTPNAALVLAREQARALAVDGQGGSTSSLAALFGPTDDSLHGTSSSNSLASLLSERRRSTPDMMLTAGSPHGVAGLTAVPPQGPPWHHTRGLAGGFAPRTSFEKLSDASMSSLAAAAAADPAMPRTSSMLSASLPSQESLSNMSYISTSRVERLISERMRRSTSGGRGGLHVSSSGEDLHASPSSSTEDLTRLIDASQALRAAHNKGIRTPLASPSASSPQRRSLDGGTGGVQAGSPGSPKRPRQRLLVVANRLPVSAARRADGGWTLTTNAGGLVSALLGVRDNFETTWIGWPGLEVTDPAEQKKLAAALATKGCLPVFIDQKTFDMYYNGYSNEVLWPLFHYIPLPTHDRLDAAQTLRVQWAAYQRANRLFSRAVLSAYQEGDVVWCHDYHLALLPQYLKELRPSMKVGWFLHTPFPSSEIFRTLPLRSEILRGVLHADLTGFHTYDYARHFVSACTRILGLEGTPAGVEDSGRVTRVCAFPIGVDPERFWAMLRSDSVRANIAGLRERFAGKKVMLGVDRLDVIKGIPQKLLAFEKFLEENPEWRSRVLLVQIAVPTRVNVPEYKALRSQVHEIVGRINGRFGTLASVPIHHLDRSIPFHELCALYAVTDVALVTSLRDGMNLVSYEFVACQTGSHKGVLMLSEFAGAAQSLGAGAILVNPWDVTDMSHGIKEALTMSEEEREERHRHSFAHVVAHTAQSWADTFVSELNDTHVEAQLRTASLTMPLPHDDAIDAYASAKRRLLIIGYNGTLTTSLVEGADSRRRYDQVKGRTRMHPAAKGILERLTRDPSTTVLVISGSERHKLENLMGDLPVWLSAENGVFLRPPERGAAWRSIHHPSTLNLTWIESVQMVMDYFRERTPRSTVDTRETSIVWSYKHSDPDFGRAQARDMLQHLWTGPISNAAVDVFQGARSVEVRPVGISKGMSLEKVLTEIAPHLHEGDMSANGHGHAAETAVFNADVTRSEVPACPRTSLFDYVMVLGHFLPKDEDLFTYFEPNVMADEAAAAPSPSPMGSPSAYATEKTAKSPDKPTSEGDGAAREGVTAAIACAGEEAEAPPAAALPKTDSGGEEAEAPPAAALPKTDSGGEEAEAPPAAALPKTDSGGEEAEAPPAAALPKTDSGVSLDRAAAAASMPRVPSSYDLHLTNGDNEHAAGGGSTSIVCIKGKDRQELLRDMTLAMGRLGLHVQSAVINTEGEYVLNEFRVSYHGRAISAEEWPMVRAELLAACHSNDDQGTAGAEGGGMGRRAAWRTELFGPHPRLHSVTVGRRTSLGQYYVGNSEDALAVLQAFAEVGDGATDAVPARKKLSFRTLAMKPWTKGASGLSDAFADPAVAEEDAAAEVDAGGDELTGPTYSVSSDALEKAQHNGTAAMAILNGSSSGELAEAVLATERAHGQFADCGMDSGEPEDSKDVSDDERDDSGVCPVDLPQLRLPDRALSSSLETVASALMGSDGIRVAPSPSYPLVAQGLVAPPASSSLAQAAVTAAGQTTPMPPQPSSPPAVPLSPPAPVTMLSPAKRGFWHELKGGPTRR